MLIFSVMGFESIPENDTQLCLTYRPVFISVEEIKSFLEFHFLLSGKVARVSHFCLLNDFEPTELS